MTVPFRSLLIGSVAFSIELKMTEADMGAIEAEQIADEELVLIVLARFCELPDAIELDIDAI